MDKEIINRILVVKIRRVFDTDLQMQKLVYQISDVILKTITDKDGNPILFEGNVIYHPIFMVCNEIENDYELGFLDDAKVSADELRTLIEASKAEYAKISE